MKLARRGITHIQHKLQVKYYVSLLKFLGNGSTLPMVVDLQDDAAEDLSVPPQLMVQDREEGEPTSSDEEVEDDPVNAATATQVKKMGAIQFLCHQGPKGPTSPDILACHLFIPQRPQRQGQHQMHPQYSIQIG